MRPVWVLLNLALTLWVIFPTPFTAPSMMFWSNHVVASKLLLPGPSMKLLTVESNLHASSKIACSILLVATLFFKYTNMAAITPTLAPIIAITASSHFVCPEALT